MGSSLRVGILGTRWGRTHVGTFRAAGCRIEALVDRNPARSEEIARAEGVPRWDLGALEEVDLVVIATPVETHRELVRRWSHKAIWCEKPFSAEARGPRIGVNYAFSFLDAARRLRAGIGASRPAGAEVEVSAGAGDGWVAREIAVHPLSFLQVALGPLSVRRFRGFAEPALLDAGGVPVSLTLRPDEPGRIALRISVDGVGGLEGRLLPGVGWRFDDRPEDPWYPANCAAAAAFVRSLGGEEPPEELFLGARAERMERGLGPLLA